MMARALFAGLGLVMAVSSAPARQVDWEDCGDELDSLSAAVGDAQDAAEETQDAGQEPQRGGLLYAKYGAGVYIYNAYAFYRQLPEGVPGAYRIFANLLSLAKNPEK